MPALLSQFSVEELGHRGLEQEVPEIVGGVGERLSHQIAADCGITVQ